MKSIDKLRRMITEIDMRGRTDENGVITVYMSKGERRTLKSVADEIETEIADNYLELPVDADGVPIRIGDVLDPPKGSEEYGRLMVTELTYDGEDWYFKGEIPASFTGQAGYFNVIGFTHVKPRTLEDVLVDMLEAAVGYSDAHTDVSLVAVEKYADEIRELLGGDAE